MNLKVTPSNGFGQTPTRMTFGERLEAARLRAGLSQNKLGNLINNEIDSGYNDTNIRNWEQDKHWPHARIVPVIATILGVTTDYLYGLTDDPHGHSDALGPIGK